MTLEAKLDRLIELQEATLAALSNGAAQPAPAAKEEKSAKGKGKGKTTPPPKEDDLDAELGGGDSDPGSELDDELGGDDDELGGDDEPKYTKDQVKALLLKVKAEVGKDTALEIMHKIGKSKTVDGIASENFDATAAACEKKLSATKKK